MNCSSISAAERQKWIAQTGKQDELIDITPTEGDEGTVVTVVVQSQIPPAKLAFNSLLLNTQQMHMRNITTLVAVVPPFQHTRSLTSLVPVSICFLAKDIVTETTFVADFLYTTDKQKSPLIQNNTLLNDFYSSSTFDYPIPIYPQQDDPEFLHPPCDSSTTSRMVANYQPYPGLISRTNLEIIGDLNSIMTNWSLDEVNTGRRLVQFFIHEDGPNSKLKCEFQPFHGTPQPTSNAILVSCIYWEERNDFFITSVDCIYLLESIMSTRFSIEEKNRIRRNLEGFRPLTIGKCKQESTTFFKRIMGFPYPKPRNIEKDVKVFPWRTLPFALKKIVTKYSTLNKT